MDKGTQSEGAFVCLQVLLGKVHLVEIFLPVVGHHHHESNQEHDDFYGLKCDREEEESIHDSKDESPSNQGNSKA